MENQRMFSKVKLTIGNNNRACCSVPGCVGNLGDKRGFLFPKDKKVRLQWQVAIKRLAPGPAKKLWSPYKHSVVCQNHFTPDDFRVPLAQVAGTKMPLKPWAVPSLFAHKAKDAGRVRRSEERAKRLERRRFESSLVAEINPDECVKQNLGVDDSHKNDPYELAEEEAHQAGPYELAEDPHQADLPLVEPEVVLHEEEFDANKAKGVKLKTVDANTFKGLKLKPISANEIANLVHKAKVKSETEQDQGCLEGFQRPVMKTYVAEKDEQQQSLEASDLSCGITDAEGASKIAGHQPVTASELASLVIKAKDRSIPEIVTDEMSGIESDMHVESSDRGGASSTSDPSKVSSEVEEPLPPAKPEPKYSFGQQANRVHGKKVPRSQEGNKEAFQCPECLKMFAGNGVLKLHMQYCNAVQSQFHDLTTQTHTSPRVGKEGFDYKRELVKQAAASYVSSDEVGAARILDLDGGAARILDLDGKSCEVTSAAYDADIQNDSGMMSPGKSPTQELNQSSGNGTTRVSSDEAAAAIILDTDEKSYEETTKSFDTDIHNDSGMVTLTPEFNQSSENGTSQTKVVEDDEDAMFFKYIATQTRQMTKQNKRAFFREIQDLLPKYD